ncbi:MAG: J domain-containing protein, partial [Solimonas sp.]
AYDTLGANWKAGQQFTPPPGWGGGGRGRGRAGAGGFGGAAGGAGFSDFFSQMFGGTGGGFGGGFADFDEAEAAPDTRARLTINLEDSYQGAQKQISLGGRSLNVRIPQGVGAGQTIRLAGQGSHGGDLLLEIEFAPHPQFKLDGRDVTATVSVAPWEAALGGKISVPTLGGSVELNLPANSRSGQKLRLKQRGLPGKTPGDQFVVLQIATPPAASDEDRAFYTQMAEQFAAFSPRG